MRGGTFRISKAKRVTDDRSPGFMYSHTVQGINAEAGTMETEKKKEIPGLVSSTISEARSQIARAWFSVLVCYSRYDILGIYTRYLYIDINMRSLQNVISAIFCRNWDLEIRTDQAGSISVHLMFLCPRASTY